jgi:hypothetical protein
MFNKFKSFVTITALFSAVLTFNACKKADEVFPAPTVSAGAAASGLAGAVVKITATVNAPGTLRTLTVLKNGVQWDSKTYTTDVSDNYTKDYTVESLPANASVVFTFQATDQAGQSSTVATQVITVSAVQAKPVVTVTGTLEGNISWTKDKVYLLNGFVRVGEDKSVDGTQITKTGTLTIEPGTVIMGDRASKATLIIQRGSKIIANGTADAPIVFTSSRAAGERETGDWGGLVICGKGINNLPGGTAELEGGYGAYHGGKDNADNSGSLKYVRVEYAGIPVNPNQEINSFTLGSVGSGTVVDYCMAAYGGDDSFEWFGGSVNCAHLVAYRGIDDDFDMDNGFSGKLQYGVGVRGAAIADQSGSNGFEVDNDASGTSNTPFTSATISNFSIIGAKQIAATGISPQFQNGAHLRRNCKVKIYNTLITSYPNGIYVDGNATLTNAQNNELVLNRVIVSAVKGWGDNGFGTATTGQVNPNGFAVRDVNTASPAVALQLIGGKKPSEWFVAQTGNKLIADWSTTGISENLWSAGRPTFTLTIGKADGLEKGGVSPTGFEAADFLGAFKDNDWTAKWTNFASQTTDYSK